MRNLATPDAAVRPVALVGALDRKHREYDYLRQRLSENGVPSLLIDVGVLDEPGVRPDVDRATVAAEKGMDISALATAGDRNAAMVTMAAGASSLVSRWQREHRISAVLVVGGSNAGYIMSRLAAALPIGFPKLLVSTIVAGDTRPYVQCSDLAMLYPVVDLAGLNSITSQVLARAADALAGIVTGPPLPDLRAESIIGCSMFGVTTACVEAMRPTLERRGHELQVFHANGTGGRTLERMINSGAFSAVVDVTTTELADELLGGVCSAGPERLTGAVRKGIPQVVSVGALDMVNFGPRQTVPERYASRKLFEHNPAVTLMRTSAEESAHLGRWIAQRLNEATAPTQIHVPARGFSQISTPGGPFHDPAADDALIDELRARLAPHVPVTVHALEINDPEFAGVLAGALAEVLTEQQKRS